MKLTYVLGCAMIALIQAVVVAATLYSEQLLHHWTPISAGALVGDTLMNVAMLWAFVVKGTK